MLVNCSEREKPPMSSTTIITTPATLASKSAGAATKDDDRRALAINVRRKPKRARMRGAIVFIASAPTPVASVIDPASKALRPNPVCSSSGSRNGLAPTPTRKNNPPRRPARKVRILSRRRSIGGAGRCNAWTT